MQIIYDESIPANDQPLVMTRGDHERVEMHLRQDEQRHYTLFAFAGDHRRPARTQQQGPYHCLDQANGARRAIAAALRTQGYRVSDDVHPVWCLEAQRCINALRDAHEQFPVSYKFDPKDVYLDW
jgi:hypothetical protein